MAYKVLYRKYRPDSFDKIIGQKFIVDTLKQSIKNNTISHAYIFTGPRGTGKTSTAKVFAKAINCSNNADGEACNKCDNCVNFSTSPDIIEIDAASNNGVDEIRELRNNITLAPAASSYKVYIIDEVHMLSPGAFNALLKTLEEPPAHAIFILATTEIYKVPITILSRCQRFDFKKINSLDMIKHLEEICEKENIKYDHDALEEIHSLSEGCLRDALSILDQLYKTSEKIDLKTVYDNYDIISNKSIDELLALTTQNDVTSVIEKLEQFENIGMNAQKLIKKMINYLETVAIDIKLNKNNTYKFENINNLINDLNQIYIDARINDNVFVLIKLSFLKQIKLSSNQEVKSKFNEKINDNAQVLPQKELSSHTEKIPEKDLSLVDIRINNCFVGANKESLNEINKLWDGLDNNKITSICLTDYKPVVSSKDYAIFTSEDESLAKLFNIKAIDIENMLQKGQLTTKVIAISEEEWNNQKKKYIKNIKNKYKYEIINEPEIKDASVEIKKQATDLFTDDLIEIS